MGRSTALTRTLAGLVFLAVATVAAAGCGTTSGTRGSPFDGAGGSAEGDQVEIEIRNQNFNDATVWAVTPGSERRLGIVSGKSTRTYTLDWSRTQSLQLRIRIQSGPTCLTRRIATDPGDSYQLVIDVDFEHSRACRR